jgi:hypothetical protein
MMGTMPLTPFRAIPILALVLLWGPAHAQDNEPYAADPPERAARLSYIAGEVSLQPAGEEEWAPALLNRPLTTGDKLWTEREARAEIYVGPAAVRLDGDTGFSFLNVGDDTIQMRLTAGVINVSVRRLEGNEHIEIDTPNIALTLLRAGNYRVEVNDAGDSTVVKVSEGAVQATGPSQDTVVNAQQVVTFTGTDNLVAHFAAQGAPDEFDSWSLERDRRDDRAASSRTAEYVSPEVTGYQDLEDNGTWSSEPEYGYVWTPRNVAVGWAPYSFGRWVWISPWGYTWIDDARWGYAPFHYGRWAHIRHRWCWVPGPRHVRAVYAPALVGWGGRRGNHVSWFPLGPRDVYVPGRRYSRHYMERVNTSNTRVVNPAYLRDVYDRRDTNLNYRNRAVPGAVTGMLHTAFASAGRTRDHRVRLNEQAQDQSSAGAPQIAPERASRLGGPARADMRVPPRNIVDRQVVVRRNPPPAAAGLVRRAPERVIRREDNGRAASLRDRPDRPPRVERPVNASAPPAQTSVFDRRALADRVREDRDRQVRAGQQQRQAEYQRREVEEGQRRGAAVSQRWQRPEEVVRQQREQQHDRERGQRQQGEVRQVAPRVEQRERSTERPQTQTQRPQTPQPERPQVERPQVQRPQVERSNRSEAPQRPAESRSQRPRSTENNSRSNR